MSSLAYRVELDLFSGPLDLLLYLVRRNELEILDLQVAVIVGQFQDYLEVLTAIDLDIVGDFIVMASTLTEIKSRMVLPQEREDTEPEFEEDPRSDLIQQLLEYRKFKDAAQQLEDRAAEWQERYPRLTDDRPRTGRDASRDRIKEVELWDLVSALGRILKLQDETKQSSILYDDTPIAVYTERIGARVRAENQVAFTSLFGDETLRSKVIGMFLAILELLRHHGFRAQQEAEYGEIWILPPLEPAANSSPDSIEPLPSDNNDAATDSAAPADD
ncbi:MAG TPA: chromosome segregation protein ScpA [Planctomycetaceae bacterium]|nr:chromosome segregation protein ScpA [Planctomycetaceae bacterium]